MTRDPSAPARRVLVVDDEESMRWFVRQGLGRFGYTVEVAVDADSGLRALNSKRFDAAVLDVRLPGASGMTLLQHVKAHDPDTVVVMITAHGSIPAAVDAIKRGAFDYVSKPFEVAELAAVLERGFSSKRAPASDTAPAIVAESVAMRAVLAQVERVKDAAAGVLITGESGSGKELVARTLHARSARSGKPFVAINCAALPDALIASELFGHEPGAFTGATGKRAGLLVRADGGTLLLDEIAELRPESQSKLERFLQHREVVPLGGDVPTRVDVRVLAATSRDLTALVEQGLFRRELFFRIAVVPIEVPPLRQRVEDIAALAQQALQRSVARSGGMVEGFDTAAMAALQSYAWPGNVRELQNLIERAAVLHGCKDSIEFDDLPEELRAAGRARVVSAYGGVVEYEHALLAFERQYLTNVLERAQGNMSEAARIAGLSRGHLHRKVKQLGIDSDTFRGR